MDVVGVAQPATHVPVMRDRVTDLLSVPLHHPGAVFVDCTLGLAGHAVAILTANPQARLIGIDRDPQALSLAGARLAEFGDRVSLVEAVYHELPEVLQECGLDQVDAILADLGLSSLQIDVRERGFAYAVDAPLDMRMDGRQPVSAATIVNTASASDLARILRRYGEEKCADRIARGIVAAREEEPFTTSARLVQVITDAIPMALRRQGGHPAKRTFQALRIEVNQELASLEKMLPAALAALAPGGRLAVLAYHSLEDRLVKRVFQDATTDRAPRDLPVVPPEFQARFRLVTRGAERPDATECRNNPRASSARLRVIERKGGVS